VEEIALRLSSENPEVRRLAIDCLIQLDSVAEPYAPRLGKLIADPDVGVRNVAKFSFRVLGPYANGAAMNLAKLLWHADPIIRKHALSTMDIVKEHSGTVAAEAIAKQIDIIIKSTSAEKAAQDRARKAAGKAVETFNGTDPTSALRLIMTILCDYGPLAAPYGTTIIKFLEHRDVTLRAVAVRCLICSGADAANNLKAIKKNLDHPDPDVRRAAVDVLRGLAPLNRIVAESMGKVLLEDASEADANVLRLRVQVLRILGGAGVHAKKFLVDMARELESTDFQVRRAALEALVDLKEHAVPAGQEISRRLLHADPVIRRIAVETIGSMGPHCATYIGRVEALADTEDDPDVINAVKVAAQRAKDIPPEAFDTKKQKVEEAPKRRRSVQAQRSGKASEPGSPKSPGSPKW